MECYFLRFYGRRLRLLRIIFTIREEGVHFNPDSETVIAVIESYERSKPTCGERIQLSEGI